MNPIYVFESLVLGSLTVVSNFSLTKSLKTLIISMLLSFFIVKFVKIIVLIWAMCAIMDIGDDAHEPDYFKIKEL